tara:strand:+ start:1290 stop:1946 length:657 start_codon:yes stop_codon:yes gene_type:complete
MARFSNNDLFHPSAGTGELQKTASQTVQLIELHFDPANNISGIENIYLTDCFFDISYDSSTAPDSGANTYSSVGNILSISPVQESTQLRVNTLTATLSGVDNAIMQDILHHDIVNTRVVIYRAFLVDNTFNTSKVYMMFDGIMKSWSVKEAADTATISANISTHWANFEQKAGRKTNSTSQQNTRQYNTTATFFTKDKGFEFASAMINDIAWGPRGKQ